MLCLTILARGQKASPAIPLDPYFQRWRQGCPLERLAEEVFEAGRQALGFSGWEGEDFFCYERVKDRIFQMVISREQNREILGRTALAVFSRSGSCLLLPVSQNDTGSPGAH